MKQSKQEYFMMCEDDIQFQSVCPSIKFYRNTATAICLQIISDHFPRPSSAVVAKTVWALQS